MKKLLLIAFIGVFISNIFGQAAAEKKFKAGFYCSVGMNIQTTKSSFFNKTIGGTVGFGFKADYGFTKNIWISTGLEVDFDYYKFEVQDPVNNPLFYYATPTEIETYSIENTVTSPTLSLRSRQYKPIYLSLPILVKFKTNFYGEFRYYGELGFRFSFATQIKVNDKNNSNLGDFKNLLLEKEISWFRANAVAGLGAEWNFTKSLLFNFGIQYQYGMTNNFRKEPEHTVDNNLEIAKLHANQHLVSLHVGILF